jgi:lipoic acid synthetase
VHEIFEQRVNTRVRSQKPAWLRKSLPSGPAYEQVRKMVRDGFLHTVCQEAKCPNQWECFSHHTATFLIMGDRCTRNCRFCAVRQDPETGPDPEEPKRVADAVASLGLRYAVVTSVTRDDLPDGGGGVFAETISEIRKRVNGVLVEVLVPDFQGDEAALSTVLDAGPDILNHNIETVPRLYPLVRPQADYLRSLELLKRVKELKPSIPAKSGIMLGLGETSGEIEKTLEDVYRTGCRMMTIGQYLRPSSLHLPVERFVPPEEFDGWRETALGMGFREVFSGPFVRSSYRAHEMYRAVLDRGK